MVVVILPAVSFPPTASSSPCSEAQVGKVTGVSASWCHTLGLLVNERVFSHAITSCDCGWKDWRRAASEQVKTDFDRPLLPNPPSM